jgi:Flp pilus assembly protein TadG
VSGKLRVKARRAAAAVELAVVTPVLLTMLFGIIEFGWMFTVRQALVTATREGARTAVLPGSTTADVVNRVTEFLQPLGLTGYTTTVQEGGTGEPSGTVTVAIPYANVTLVSGYFGGLTGELTATCSMRKEAVD